MLTRHHKTVIDIKHENGKPVHNFNPCKSEYEPTSQSSVLLSQLSRGALSVGRGR